MTLDVWRIVVIPLAITAFGLMLSVAAARSRGRQEGAARFRLWFQPQGSPLKRQSPCTLQDIGQFFTRTPKKGTLVDITELAGIDAYFEIGFDLSVAALTTDAIAIFGASTAPSLAPLSVGMLAVHLPIAFWIFLLARADHLDRPDAFQKARSISRTVFANLLGLFSLCTALAVLWEAL